MTKVVYRWVSRVVVILVLAFLVRACFEMEFLFSRIELGMSESQVIEIIGKPPRLEEEQLMFCQGPPSDWFWLGDCAQALRSEAVRFLIWKHGPDSYYVIGLSEKNRVVYKSRGDV